MGKLLLTLAKPSPKSNAGREIHPACPPRIIHPKQSALCLVQVRDECLPRVWKSLPHTACPLKCQGKWQSLEGFCPIQLSPSCILCPRQAPWQNKPYTPKEEGNSLLGFMAAHPAHGLCLKLATSANCIQQGVLY